MSNVQNSSRFGRSSRQFLIPFTLDDVDQSADVNLFSIDFNRLMKDFPSLMNMIREMQKYVIAQRNDLDEISVIVRRIEKEKDVVVIERDEAIRELNEAKTIVRFCKMIYWSSSKISRRRLINSFVQWKHTHLPALLPPSFLISRRLSSRLNHLMEKLWRITMTMSSRTGWMEWDISFKTTPTGILPRRAR